MYFTLPVFYSTSFLLIAYASDLLTTPGKYVLIDFRSVGQSFGTSVSQWAGLLVGQSVGPSVSQ